ncbi:hypothetical protein PVAP13_2KG395205 [Panicum virgatum]|uniref:Uncharacterized protein n=1 Tax=Panicum virgatum TaxID=38727 RepID=A0A8T0WIM0_PANVG|nr:hypothetical protein PVAP13_2KG395205 [Panicum virgatum]
MHDGALKVKAAAAESYCIPDVCRANGVHGRSSLDCVISYFSTIFNDPWLKLQRRIRSELPKCLLIFPRAHHANYFLPWTKLYLSTKVMQTIVHNISWFTCCGF